MIQQIDAPFAQHFLGRLYAAVNAHDGDAVAELCCEHVEWEDPGAPAILRGRDAVRRFHIDILFRAFPDMKVEMLDGPFLSLDGTGVASRLRLSGTMTGPMIPPGFAATGRPIAFETAEFSRFEGGLLARHTVILDMLDIARQIGAAPRAGSFGDRMGIWLQNVAARR
jgi:predicted ester cyclase